MKKFLPLLVLPVALLTLSGCSDATQAESSQLNSQKMLEETQKRLQESVPVPTINNSQTRKAIAERAKVFDAENKVTYVYLINYGKVMAFYPVKGQVVSLRSYLTPVDKLINERQENCTWSSSESPCFVITAPDIDGTYGENADGIFFFTADTNAYVEWKGDYMVSDQPLKLSQQPELIREVK